MGGLLLKGRGKLTSAACRQEVIELLAEANAAGASLVRACNVTCICLRPLNAGGINLKLLAMALIAVKAVLAKWPTA